MTKNLIITEKHIRFVELFIETGNATASYFQAFGVKYQSANANAGHLLAEPKIQDLVIEKQKELLSRLELKIGAIVNQYTFLWRKALRDIDHADPPTRLNAIKTAQGILKDITTLYGVEKGIIGQSAPMFNIQININTHEAQPAPAIEIKELNHDYSQTRDPRG